MNHEKPSAPRPVVRCVVSLLLLAHLGAILTAVTASSSPNFPAPLLAARASEPLQPYLQATFLNNAYRFFAPNPGTPSVLWFRVQDEERVVRWLELPGAADSWLREPYQRRLNLAIQITQHLIPDPAHDGKRRLTPLGQVCLESCVRHLAATCSRSSKDGDPVPIRSVGVYFVQHAPITPAQVRSGWNVDDLRTYSPTFVGAYDARGVRVDEFRPDTKVQPIQHLVAGMVEVDLLPLLKHRSDSGGAVALPMPVRRFLADHPELVTHSPGDDLTRRIEKLMAGPHGGS